MAIILSGLPTVSGVVFSRRVTNVELSAANPTVTIDQPGAYEFRLDTETLTSTTVTINEAPVTVADVEGQFVWDQGGVGEHTFTFVGETIYRTYGGEIYQIGWLGLGSQKFFARSVLNAQTPPPPPPPVNASPVWSTAANLGSVLEGTAVGITLSATDSDGTIASYAVIGGTLPSGVTLSGGTLGGTAPLVASDTTYNFLIRTTDDDGAYADRAFTLTVLHDADASPVWSTPTGSIGSFQEGTEVSFQFVATDDGTVDGYAITGGSLPSGITLASDGLLSGTAPTVTSNQTFNFTVTATDNTGQGTPRNFSLVVANLNQSPVWTTNAGSLGTFSGNAAVTTSVVATDPDGTIASYAVVSGSLPSGLSLNATTGAITGTATNPASDTTSYFTIRATDNDGGYVERAFDITVTVSTSAYNHVRLYFASDNNREYTIPAGNFNGTFAANVNVRTGGGPDSGVFRVRIWVNTTLVFDQNKVNEGSGIYDAVATSADYTGKTVRVRLDHISGSICSKPFVVIKHPTGPYQSPATSASPYLIGYPNGV